MFKVGGCHVPNFSSDTPLCDSGCLRPLPLYFCRPFAPQSGGRVVAMKEEVLTPFRTLIIGLAFHNDSGDYS